MGIESEKYCKNCIWFIPLNIKEIIEKDLTEVERRRICQVGLFHKKIVPIEGSRCVNPKEYKEPTKWN
jgi:hypothetical protein